MSAQRKTSAARKGRQDLTLLRRNHTRSFDSPDAAILEAFENTHPGRDYWIILNCPEFTSLCPVTGQPDFGRITIRYVPDKLCVESKSLKLYLRSFRNHGTFHEESVNRILGDIEKTVSPRQLTVKGEFNTRGGIAITVEASSP